MFQLFQKDLMEMFFSLLRLIVFARVEWMIWETMKNTIDFVVFPFEAATNKPPNRDNFVPSHSTHLTRFAFIIKGITKQFLSSCLQISLHPIKSLSKWWQARRRHRSRPHPPGDGNICPKTMSVVKIFNSGSKWRISGTGRCHLWEPHSWAALRNIPLMWLR